MWGAEGGWTATDLAGECRRLWVESRCQVSVYALRSAASCLRVIQANQNYPSSKPSPSTNNTIPGLNTRLTPFQIVLNSIPTPTPTPIFTWPLNESVRLITRTVTISYFARIESQPHERDSVSCSHWLRRRE